MMKSLLAAMTSAITLTACAQAADNFAHDPERDHIGRIYTYVRSNIDGSRPENILVFRRDRENIEVNKWVSRCTNAALVTAEMDFDTMSARRITGGRLLPDAQHMEFAYLTYDEERSHIAFDLNLPDQSLNFELDIADGPWHLFDFDFASLTVVTPHLADVEAGFAFEMPLFWTDLNNNPIRNLGQVRAVYSGTEEINGVATHRLDVSGGTAGSLWLSAEDGHVVRAVLDEPNHNGYEDFKLDLVSISDGGAEEWTDLLRAQFEGCE